MAFGVAAFLEIAGCFAFWNWFRRGASAYVAVLGVASLVGFAITLTRVETAFAGRAYAADGGIYIAASLLWLWLAEGQRPTQTDLIGAGIAAVGALIILGFGTKTALRRYRPHRLRSTLGCDQPQPELEPDSVDAHELQRPLFPS